MPKAMAQILNELQGYLLTDSEDLAEMIVDFCEGDEFLDPHTAKLMGQLVNSMPEPDNFSIEDLATEIRHVGTPFAVGLANDINCIYF